MRTAAVTAGGDGSDRCKVTDRRSEGGKNGRSLLLLLLFRQVGCVRYGGGGKKKRRLPKKKKKRVLDRGNYSSLNPIHLFLLQSRSPHFRNTHYATGDSGGGDNWGGASLEEAWHHLDLTLEGMG